jgi:hypothetical protein
MVLPGYCHEISRRFSYNTYGFIYQVTHIPTKRKYIGKKVLYFERNKKLGKKELKLLKEERKQKGLKGRTPSKKKIVKESDWKTYYGSHKDFIQLIKQGRQEEFKREILQIVYNKKLLTYYENKHLFLKGVIEPNSNYINDNIEGRYFKKDFYND